jgi:hypothetical protein
MSDPEVSWRQPNQKRYGLIEETAVSNPWLKKNPFLSMWLSGANSVANSARVRIAAEAKRQLKTGVTQASTDMFAIWANAMRSPAPRRRKRR